jgi:arylsulfatase A-like enzyme
MTTQSSRIRRVATWLGAAAAVAAVGALAGGAVEALGSADDGVEAVATIGFAAVLAWPALFLLVVIVRGLWWGWRPERLAERLVDEHGRAPRLAAWIAYLLVACFLLSWATFNAVLLLAGWTAFRPMGIALTLPPILIAVALVLVAASRPAVELLTLAAERADRGIRKLTRGRSLLGPRTILVGGPIALAVMIYVGWRISVRPRVGYIDLDILRYPAVAIVATIAAHAVARRFARRRATPIALAVASTLLVAAIGVAVWTRAARPASLLQIWARPTIASEVIETLYYLEDIRADISLLVKPPVIRPGATPRDVVLITIDTVRADHTPLGGGNAEMPRLATFGNAGAVFTAAFAPGNVTRRSIPAIATGVSPTRIRGKVAGWALRLDPRHVLLAERFRAAGYDTAGFFCCTSFWGSVHRLGINRGIDHIMIEYDGRVLSDAASKWVAARRAAGATKPLFLWVHFIEPHNWTRGAPDMKTPADRRAQYDRVLGEVDRHLGRVLDAFAPPAIGDRAPVIAVTADHGEGLGDHGQPYHSGDLYDSQIHVPLAIAGPGIAPHRVVEPVGLIGLAPTLLDLAGFVPPGMPAMDGESFARLATTNGPGDPNGGYAFSAMIKDRSAAIGLRAVVRGPWKLIETSRGYELYNRASNPAEDKDLSQERKDKLAEMIRLLESRRAIDKRSPFGP